MIRRKPKKDKPREQRVIKRRQLNRKRRTSKLRSNQMKGKTPSQMSWINKRHLDKKLTQIRSMRRESRLSESTIKLPSRKSNRCQPSTRERHERPRLLKEEKIGKKEKQRTDKLSKKKKMKKQGSGKLRSERYSLSKT